MKKIIVVGGGLAGLVAAVQLARAGMSCVLIEKKVYPFHRVCGEYISNEAVPFLKANDLFPAEFEPPAITRFTLSSASGRSSTMALDLGGFGISRFTFDHFLFKKVLAAGVEVLQGEEVQDVFFGDNRFQVKTDKRMLIGDIVVGAFGKRSRLDHFLKRRFISERSPYVGVKYHVRTNHPADLIALHNFEGGYCGMSNIEDGKTTLCYLTHRDHLKKFRNISHMEEQVMYKNPLLQKVFAEAEFLFDKPEVINEVSFRTKSCVEDHVLMAGDSAGMIAPLCGNGMAMAIHGAKLLSDVVTQFAKGQITRAQLEEAYTREWNKNFRSRLWRGRQIQKLFGSYWASHVAVSLAVNVRPVALGIMRSTHGDPF
ncbi:NAD(P)/FAD-dependent oxidoreductase [Chryseolinea lacunae]|uniref:NAD(P)/FAD-dependent oxidoreductase n=1 Tax=Chryseolinea lacunae TaxID=2801331 RepID=A0ABS1KQE5_9BACT|nr:NAD(P)/FAD-dependent oxidoreductase [Chryseolinea lacunae]MBL0741690.1 NAD(P)/FAD-dependent oxidoreductase [Chryseolinea lacunae]